MICRMCGKPKPGHMFWEGEHVHFRVCRECRTGLSTALHEGADSVRSNPNVELIGGCVGDNIRPFRLSGIVGDIAFVIAQLPPPPENRERVHAVAR